ncbi:hypothetical protein SPBR_02074 [Sporothrix brasiliensis 5110]|uniref:Histone chaperone domain-containing protein n=1 Tax=Sporothrix brasiliensis 5110 TaxID=1398154 RepID=A0A0C2IXX3_9PEZI|nr:uncharacterized protein SPBR_02074 [Sporothrix brasiliensis 5110]KIH91585.1 hypothetical protein SPBR_02074 [Sporothrix brasiliensis 5110]
MATNGNGVQDPTIGAGAQAVTDPTDFKGKGKAPAAEDDDMKDVHDEDEDEDDDEDDDEEEEEAADVIDLDNVIGRRTRGVVIDYAKAAAENPVEEDEDEEDDGDFEEPDDMDED